MTKNIIISFFLLSLVSLHGQDVLQIKKNAIHSIDEKKDLYGAVSDSIWEYAELGFLEFRSADLLISFLQKNGFTIEKGIAGIPTAFMASYGEGETVVGLLAEYDALPGLTQSRNPVQENISERNSGHGCGHNLLGTASVAAAIAVKEQIETHKLKGKIILFGTPAEEGGSGKVYLAREGFFKSVDVMLHWHPGTDNSVNFNAAFANTSAKFRFYGVSSHASSSPDKGKSALDAVEAMNFMANLYREHAPLNSRIHYVITKGGESPNVVPAFAEVYYYVRHKNEDEVRKMFEQLVSMAKGAAMGTNTSMDYEIIGGTHSILPVEKLSKVLYQNLKWIEMPDFTDEEKKFARQLQSSFSKQDTIDFKHIAPFEMKIDESRLASTDVGDVTWNVPTAGLRIMSYVPGTQGHSWQAAACSGSPFGKRGMIIASKVMAATVIELLNSPDLILEIQKEWESNKGNYVYKPLIGDRMPALDYRK